MTVFMGTSGAFSSKTFPKCHLECVQQSMGPNVATPELFAEALFTDTSSWTVIDRGPFEALLPITHVLENMLDSFDPSSVGKMQLEVCACANVFGLLR